MKANFCRMPNALDRSMAIKYHSDAVTVSTLRGMYENITGEKVIEPSDYEKLIQFKNSLTESQIQQFTESLVASEGSVLQSLTAQLHRNLGASLVQEATDLLYSLFEDEVNEAYSTVGVTLKNSLNRQPTRMEIINGVGVANIFETCAARINNIMDTYKEWADYYKDKNQKYYNHYNRAVEDLQKILDNFDALIYASKPHFEQMEGISFGRRLPIVVAFTGNEDLSYKFDIETATKEKWQIENDKQNPISQVGIEVRSYLSRLPKYIRDPKNPTVFIPATGARFGETLRADFVTLHRELTTLFSGCRDINQMLTRLQVKMGSNPTNSESMNINNYTYNQIYSDLQNNEHLKNAFFRDFYRTHIEYERVQERYNGILDSFRISNRFSQPLSTWQAKIEKHYNFLVGDDTMDKSSVFGLHSKDGRQEVVVDTERFEALRSAVVGVLDSEAMQGVFKSASVGRSSIRIIEYNQNSDATEITSILRKVVNDIRSYLAIDITADQMEGLFQDINILQDFLGNMYDFLSNSSITDTNGIASFKSVFNNTKTVDNLDKALKALDRAFKVRSSSVRIGESTYFNDVITSKLSDSIDIFQSYVTDVLDNIPLLAGNKDNEGRQAIRAAFLGLKNYLDTNFLCSSVYSYVSNGKRVITSMWLRNLYTLAEKGVKDVTSRDFESAVAEVMNPTSFIRNFTIDRIMCYKSHGEDILVENFSKNRDLAVFFQQYFKFSSRSTASFAKVPIFTMGDADALKMLTTSKLDRAGLLEEFAILARSEVNRMMQHSRFDTNQRVAGNGDRNALTYGNGNSKRLGKSNVDITSEVTGDFIFLPALNKYKKVAKGSSIYNSLIEIASTNSELQLILNNIPADNSSVNILAIALAKGDEVFDSVVQTILDKELQNEFLTDFYPDLRKNPFFNTITQSTWNGTFVKQTLANFAKGKVGLENLASHPELASVFSQGTFDAFIAANFPSLVNDAAFQAVREEIINQKTEVFAKFNNQSIDANDISENSVLALYYLNTKLSFCNQLLLMGTDPIFFKNSMEQQKRNKAQNAPGYKMNVLAKDDNHKYYTPRTKTINGVVVPDTKQRIMYFKDTTYGYEDLPDRKFIEAIEDGLGKERAKALYFGEKGKDRISSTDGQGFRSLNSYRAIQGMMGNNQWGILQEEAYQRLQQILDSHRDYEQLSDGTRKLKGIKSEITEAEWKEIEQMSLPVEEGGAGLMFQPLKPHVSTIEKVKVDPKNPNSDIMLVPVEIKYAEVILIPEFCAPGSFMREAALQMEMNNIDLLCSDKCIKYGTFGTVDLMNETTQDGTLTGNPIDANNIGQAFSKAYIHESEWSDFRIQTNVPEHLTANQLFGTQLRKHVFATIKNLTIEMPDFTQMKEGQSFKEYLHTLSKEQRASLYNALVSSNFIQSTLKLMEVLGDDVNCGEYLANAKSRDSFGTIEDMLCLAMDGDSFEMPLCEPTHNYDHETALCTAYKKFVNKQKINGGSAVQMTGFGHTSRTNPLTGKRDFYAEDLEVHTTKTANGKINVTHVDCAMAFDLSVTINGRRKRLNFDDWCNTDGTLKLSDTILTEEDADYQRYEAYKDAEGNVRVPLIEEAFRGILDVVAYRIPTENMYSIINLRVKRFTRRILGGTIQVPPQWTQVAGFDFDIDKLYYFRKEFSYNRDLVSNYKIYKRTSLTDSQGNEITDRTEKKALFNNIFHHIYDMRPDIKEALEWMRSRVEGKHYKGKIYKYDLEDFWEQCQLTESIDKQELVEAAAKDLGYTLEEIEEIKEFKTANYTDLSDFDLSKTSNINQAILGQTNAQRNNALFYLIQESLMDYDTFGRRFVPGGFEDAYRDANIHKAIMYGDVETYDEALKKTKDEEKSLDVTNVLTTCLYNERNRVAGKVIGIMANHNTNAVYSSLLKEFSLKRPVRLFLDDKHPEGFSNLLDSGAGTDLDHTLAELLAASVDAVKKPALIYLNINAYTANVACLLARLGYNTRQIGFVLNQPIIRKICQVASDTNNKSLSNVINEVAKEVAQTSGKTVTLDESYRAFTEQELFQALVNERKGITTSETTDVQIEVLKLFNSLCNKASALSDFVKTTKFTASNAVENSIGGVKASMLTIKKYNEGKSSTMSKELNIVFPGNTAPSNCPITNSIDPVTKETIDFQSETILDRYSNNVFGIEQVAFDSFSQFIKMVSKWYPYDTDVYNDIYDFFYNHLKYDLGKEEMDTINRHFPTFYLSNLSNSLFNPDEVFNMDEGITNQEFFAYRAPLVVNNIIKMRNRIKELYQTKYNDAVNLYTELQERIPALVNISFNSFVNNAFLDMVSTEEYTMTDENGRVQDTAYIKLAEGSNFNSSLANNLYNGWELLVDKDTPLDLAELFFYYNFHTNGFDPSFKTFANRTPKKVLDKLTAGEGAYSSSYFQIIRSLLDLSNDTEMIVADDPSKGLNSTQFVAKFIAGFLVNNHLNYKYSTRKNLSNSFLIDMNGPTNKPQTHPGNTLDRMPRYTYNLETEELTLNLNDKGLSGNNLASDFIISVNGENHTYNMQPMIILQIKDTKQQNTPATEHIFVLKDLVEGRSLNTEYTSSATYVRMSVKNYSSNTANYSRLDSPHVEVSNNVDVEGHYTADISIDGVRDIEDVKAAGEELRIAIEKACKELNLC